MRLHILILLESLRRIAGIIRRWTLSGSTERHFWLDRKEEVQPFVQAYWNDRGVNRLELVRILQEELTRLAIHAERPIHVLEFGSNVGTNLSLLRNQVDPGIPLRLSALEPNQDAVKYMRRMFDKAVDIYAVDDQGFLQDNRIPETPVDIAFANAVFFSMNPTRVRRVMRKICKNTRVFVVGDETEHCFGIRSRKRTNQFAYVHPYCRWFKRMGFSIDRLVPAPDPVRSLTGFVVARRNINT